MAMVGEAVPPDIAFSLMAAKMYSLASCVMLFYDIALTLDEEVERIWFKKISWFTILYFLNRYVPPLAFIVITVSFHDPTWTREVCHRYILFPEAQKVVCTTVIGAIFITRLYAIYSRSTGILVFGVLLLAGEIAVKIWAFTDGTSVDLPEGLVGCILVGRSHIRFTFTWIAELVFDATIFSMTLCRVILHNRLRKGGTASLLNLILRDGVVYFAVIFAANVVTVIMFLAAPPNIKAFNASFSTLITNLMVSRLVLNLRTAGSVFTSQGCITGLETYGSYPVRPQHDTDFGPPHFALQTNSSEMTNIVGGAR